MRRALILAIATTPVWAMAIESAADAGWEWHGSILSGHAVEVRGVTGNIRAFHSATGQVDLTAHIEGGQEAAGVEIRVIEHSGDVTFCAVRRGAAACAEDNLTSPAARVDYEIRVPAGVRLDARTVNGEIMAQSLSSDVSAATVNGTVVVSTSGTVQAHTVNGSIEASLLRPFWTKAPEFSAVNGRISVIIPTNLKAAVHAETKNGKITTNVPRFHGTATDQKLEGQIGGAGGCNPLIIRTINGGIDLKQRF